MEATVGPGWARRQVIAATAMARAAAAVPALKRIDLPTIRGRDGHPAVGAGDGIHTRVDPALGTFPLFLVAVGRGAGRQDYQAVVDRRVTQAQ